MDRLYSECVTGSGFGSARPSQPSAREQMRHYMDQVFRQAGVFNRIDKNVRVGDYALDDDPMTIDYGYWRNDKKRGFVQTVSLSTRPYTQRFLPTPRSRFGRRPLMPRSVSRPNFWR